jgi:amidohydrolase family protein
MRITFSLLLLLLLPNLFLAEQKTDSRLPSIVLTRVTVIDATGAPPKPDMTLIISGNRIAELGKAKDVRVPEGAQVVDGAGKYLIPGLWDMHWHSAISEEGTREFFFPLAVANGVTGVRDLFGDCLKGCEDLVDIQVINKWRKEAKEGKLLAPRIVAASQIVDGAKPVFPQFLSVGDAAEARQVVTTFKQRGVDFIKVYSLLGRDAYFALADEAKRQRIPFAGHVPIYVRAIEATDAGQKSIEHMDFSSAFSTREAELMREMAEEIEKAKETRIEDLFTLSFYKMLDRHLIKIADSFDRQKVATLVERFNKNETWFCPTLVIHRADAFHDESEYTNDARLKYVTAAEKKEWAETGRFRRLPPKEHADLKRAFSVFLQIVGTMRRAGAQFLAGTDVSNSFLYPGFSLHDELALFVRAGFTPMEALQTATSNPAKYLGLSDSLGTIEKGKIADLVLLEANPLEDIRNTRRLAAVILNGRLLNRTALDKLLVDVEAAASGK